ncbi:hypothetical protein QCA50_001126 [Cerrena zonata]|uniref:HD-associated domain-containing protein n=1 Tax=Cerrena zonata TaxID=2478898 RepID=A0AAW0GY27_9APHY
MHITITRPDTKWKHEDASEALFDDLVLSNGLTGLIDNHNREFIKNLIAGRSDTCPKEKQFLFDIVANKRNGLDVDKFDYIARDSRAVDNQALSFMTRLINSARVIEHQICYDIKDANQVYELCYTRFSLHKRIYNHKTAKAIEYMIVDALLSAEPHMKIAERIHDMKRFVWLTDSILTEIQASTAPELVEARSICERINRRDLYKAVDYNVFPWDHKQQCQEYFTPERIVQAAKGLKTLDTDEHKLDEDSVKALESKHVIVDLAPMHYGMGDRNPLEKVKFYSKRSPNACLSAEPGDISLLMPAVFGEVLLRVYTRDSRFFGLVQAGYRECLKKFKRDTPSSSQQNLSDNHFTTVPANYKPPSPGKGVKRTLGSQLNVNEPLKRRAISYSAAELKMRSR